MKCEQRVRGVEVSRWEAEENIVEKVVGGPASWSIQLVPRVTDLKLRQSASLHGFLQPHSAIWVQVKNT